MISDFKQRFEEIRVQAINYKKEKSQAKGDVSL